MPSEIHHIHVLRCLSVSVHSLYWKVPVYETQHTDVACAPHGCPCPHCKDGNDWPKIPFLGKIKTIGLAALSFWSQIFMAFSRFFLYLGGIVFLPCVPLYMNSLFLEKLSTTVPAKLWTSAQGCWDSTTCQGSGMFQVVAPLKSWPGRLKYSCLNMTDSLIKEKQKSSTARCADASIQGLQVNVSILVQSTEFFQIMIAGSALLVWKLKYTILWGWPDFRLEKFFLRCLVNKPSRVTISSFQDELTDICAGLQGLVLKHLAERIQRGCEYLDLKDKLPSHFVISGGVASNIALREGLTRLTKHFNMKTVFPPPRLCTDNGVMIAWAGLEALREGQVAVPPESVLEVEV